MERAKFINQTSKCVDDSLSGLVNSTQHIIFNQTCSRVVQRSCGSYNEIALIAGGGSGHEPYPAGYVGEGMLTAAVAGNIFASPPSQHVTAALEATRSYRGSILFVINYTGDRLNFGLAAERFKSKGGCVRTVLIDDDVGVDNTNSRAGNRGLTAAILIIKMAGAMSNQLRNIDDIESMSNKINANSGTIGVSLHATSLPGQGNMFEIENGKMEYGVGIHGEHGRNKMNLQSATHIIDRMMQQLVNIKRLKIRTGERIIVLVNNLGGVSQLEMSILKDAIITWCIEKNYTIERLLCGSYMTSIDGHGISITILRIFDEEIIQLLDYPTNAPGWILPTTPRRAQIKAINGPNRTTSYQEVHDLSKLSDDDATVVKQCLVSLCDEMRKRKDELNRLDSLAGDGDCGETFNQAAQGITLSADTLDYANPKKILYQIGQIFEQDVGGTSGALYALMLNRASTTAFQNNKLDEKNVLAGIKCGLEAVQEYGCVKPGDRTMVDSLHALSQAKENGANWTDAIKATYEAAINTSTMVAAAGRASYTSQETQKNPDAGAMAIYYWIKAIYDQYEKVQKEK